MADLIKVSVQGTLPGGEVWSVNPVWEVTSGEVISFAECQAIVTAVNALTLTTNLRSMWNVATLLTGCRVEARTLGGQLENLAEGLRDSPQAGSGTNPHPYQTSVVTSLRTSTAGGRGRGRLYWPATGLTIDAGSLRINPTALTTAIGGVRNYLTSIQTAIDESVDETTRLAVWSRTTPALHAVTSIQMGDVFDVQRRRRDQLTESVQVLGYPA